MNKGKYTQDMGFAASSFVGVMDLVVMQESGETAIDTYSARR